MKRNYARIEAIFPLVPKSVTGVYDSLHELLPVEDKLWVSNKPSILDRHKGLSVIQWDLVDEYMRRLEVVKEHTKGRGRHVMHRAAREEYRRTSPSQTDL